MKKLMIMLLALGFLGSQIYAGCGCGGGRITNNKPHQTGKK